MSRDELELLAIEHWQNDLGKFFPKQKEPTYTEYNMFLAGFKKAEEMLQNKVANKALDFVAHQTEMIEAEIKIDFLEKEVIALNRLYGLAKEIMSHPSISANPYLKAQIDGFYEAEGKLEDLLEIDE